MSCKKSGKDAESVDPVSVINAGSFKWNDSTYKTDTAFFEYGDGYGCTLYLSSLDFSNGKYLYSDLRRNCVYFDFNDTTAIPAGTFSFSTGSTKNNLKSSWMLTDWVMTGLINGGGPAESVSVTIEKINDYYKIQYSGKLYNKPVDFAGSYTGTVKYVKLSN
ncbi:hypothetical protein [Filimonas lacunae]|nr:hypothetical protein [Filimonas lacunae]